VRGSSRRERGVLHEDGLLQLAQLGRRLEPQLVGERPACPAVRGEGVRLAAGAVERAHQLPVQPLPQRVRRDGLLEVGDHLAVPAGRQQQLGPLLDRGQPELAQPGHLRHRPRLRRELRQRRSAPQREGLVVRLQRGPGFGTCQPAPPRRQAREPVGVDGVRVDVEEVPGTPGDHDVVQAGGLERAPQLGHPQLQRIGGVGRWPVAPGAVDERVRRDDVTGVQGEKRQDGLLAAARQGAGAPAGQHLQGTEHADLEHGDS
jgi:hypothetical protein